MLEFQHYFCQSFNFLKILVKGLTEEPVQMFIVLDQILNLEFLA